MKWRVLGGLSASWAREISPGRLMIELDSDDEDVIREVERAAFGQGVTLVRIASNPHEEGGRNG